MIDPHRVAEVRRWLASIKDDPWYRIQPVPIGARAFVEMTGLDRRQIAACALGMARTGGAVTFKTADAIAGVMDRVLSGALIFVREARNLPWQSVELRVPKPLPPPQASLLAVADYDWWARCKACGGRRYAPLAISTQPHAACFDCLPPHRYGTVGGVMLKLPLVAKWLDEG